MARILGTGNATLDIVLTVDGYPQENDEIRCIDRSIRRGGNAANTLVVLSQLGHACSWAGMLVDTAEGKFIRDDLRLTELIPLRAGLPGPAASRSHPSC